MPSIPIPTGATTMIEIIVATAALAGAFALWLWRQHRRLQSAGVAGTARGR